MAENIKVGLDGQTRGIDMFNKCDVCGKWWLFEPHLFRRISPGEGLKPLNVCNNCFNKAIQQKADNQNGVFRSQLLDLVGKCVTVTYDDLGRRTVHYKGAKLEHCVSVPKIGPNGDV